MSLDNIVFSYTLQEGLMALHAYDTCGSDFGSCDWMLRQAVVEAAKSLSIEDVRKVCESEFLTPESQKAGFSEEDCESFEDWFFHDLLPKKC